MRVRENLNNVYRSLPGVFLFCEQLMFNYLKKVFNRRISVGGANQSTVQSKSGTIRTHLNKDKVPNEVHFHHDVQGIKVYVPVAEWHNAWARLAHSPIGNYEYVDAVNRSRLKITTKTVNGEIEADIEVARLGYGPTMKALEGLIK